MCRKAKVFFHCDAAQAVGKIPIDVESMSIDLMSISGHKIYGPKGINYNLFDYYYSNVIDFFFHRSLLEQKVLVLFT
jgi:Cys-tRNA synthase (O-phospho-L-seryl-tRNA:Cys-tRNA synthase)